MPFTLLLARLMGQYCLARWRLLSIGVVCRLSGSVTLPAGAWAVGRRLPDASAVGRPTLHGGPIRLRPVRATPCYFAKQRWIYKCVAPFDANVDFGNLVLLHDLFYFPLFCDPSVGVLHRPE